MREKILKLMGMTVGSLDKMIENIKIDGFQDVAELPPDLQAFRETVRKTLSGKREQLVDAICAVYTKHLSESDIDELVEHLEHIQKFETKGPVIFDEVLDAEAAWRNAALEEHRDMLHKMLGVPEPVAIDAPSEPLFVEPVAVQ